MIGAARRGRAADRPPRLAASRHVEHPERADRSHDAVGSLGADDPGRRRPGAEGDGHRQRDARQLLGRRAGSPAPDEAADHAPTADRRRAPTSSTSAASPAGPGSEPVPLEEELRRVLPVVEALAAGLGVPLSIDTTKAEVARRALDAGAAIVNDISAMGPTPRWPASSPRPAPGSC